MFERFTDRARRVLVLAQEEAKALEHDFIGTEHVLLGMLHEGEGLAAKALEELGLDLATVRAKVLETIGTGAPGTASDRPPFTPRSKKLLELSLREALDLGHNYIGTEHLLLGLVRLGEGVGPEVLKDAGVQEGKVRATVIELLSGFGPGVPGPGTAPGRGGGERRFITSPAGGAVPARALRRAGADPLGSHHFLLAHFDDPDSAAARVLASLGVTEAAVADRVAAMGVAGTSDEIPRSDGDAEFDLRLGDGLTLRIDDRALAHELRATLRDAAGGPSGTGALPKLIRTVLAEYLRRPADPPPAPAPEPPAAPPADPPS